jgi:glycolate oxidase iron-sulfur subunit
MASKKDLPTESPDIHPRQAALTLKADQAVYSDVLHCNRCGFCTSFCPTYLATGDEGLSPRGRNQAFRALLEGRLKDPAEAERSFSTCLLCGICTSVCFAEVPTAKLMVAGREKLLASRGESWMLKLVLRGLLPRPRLLEPLLKFLFLGKRFGISRLLLRAGILRLISPKLAAAEEMSEAAPLRFLRSRLPRRKKIKNPELVQFLACGPNYLKPSAGLATARILAASGLRVSTARNVCCGLPGVSCGDIPAARRLAEMNIARLEEMPDAVVLVDDSSCAAALKDYPQLFEDGSPWRARAEALARRTRDLSEWVAESKLPPGGRAPFSVTYHDPCKARYAQKIVNPPRQVLASLPEADVRELPEADQCCGGGGTYSFVQPEISRAVLDRKVQNISQTRAEVVATSSVSCLLQVEFGLRRAKSTTRALHLAEVLSPAASGPSAFLRAKDPSAPPPFREALFRNRRGIGWGSLAFFTYALCLFGLMKYGLTFYQLSVKVGLQAFLWSLLPLAPFAVLALIQRTCGQTVGGTLAAFFGALAITAVDFASVMFGGWTPNHARLQLLAGFVVFVAAAFFEIGRDRRRP